MTTLTSTVPGAISVLQTHLQAAADSLPDIAAGVYVGMPGVQVSDNFLMVGEYETGEVLTGYRQDWAGFPAAALWKSEQYGLMCTLRAWSGDTDPVARFTDAFNLLDAALGELAGDPKGSGALSPSGSWQVSEVTAPAAGPLAGIGWGVVLAFVVEVANVRLAGTS